MGELREKIKTTWIKGHLSLNIFHYFFPPRELLRRVYNRSSDNNNKNNNNLGGVAVRVLDLNVIERSRVRLPAGACRVA